VPVSEAAGSARAIEAPKASGRVTSLDIVRGIAMILMAIDHVRVYSGVPAGGPTFGVFFTRWITNFVAPAFVFLAGTSAYLYGRKYADRWSLSKFLAARGVWLIFLELTFLRIAWTFNFDFQHYLLAGVIWMLGWSMIALAGAVYLPRPAIATIGVALIALHNVTNLSGHSLRTHLEQRGRTGCCEFCISEELSSLEGRDRRCSFCMYSFPGLD
jgi:uncharacterized membrane protein